MYNLFLRKNYLFGKNYIIFTIFIIFIIFTIFTIFSSHELGNYSAERIDRPVPYGWDLKDKKEYKVRKVLCGNGSTIIIEVPIGSKDFYDDDNKEDLNYVPLKVQNAEEYNENNNEKENGIEYENNNKSNNKSINKSRSKHMELNLNEIELNDVGEIKTSAHHRVETMGIVKTDVYLEDENEMN